jgi:hypothetical protein
MLIGNGYHVLISFINIFDVIHQLHLVKKLIKKENILKNGFQNW